MTNAEYKRQQRIIDDGLQEEADRMALDIYQKAIDFENEIRELVRDNTIALSTADVADLTNLMGVIGVGVSLEVREILKRRNK